MRLINTETLELKEFFGNPKGSYTILSHTWGNSEVTLQEFQSSQDASSDGRTSSVAAKAGYLKIMDCCRRSRDDGYRWTWVDTCCIDKTNSVELSEAINSMFEWYQNAAICYIFLDDVEKTPSLGANPRDALQKSRWFTRGWTLQELIAPQRLIMFDTAWQSLGELLDGSPLLGAVSQVAGIPESYFNENSIYSASISMRMSWAAKRQTTRGEDIAYCLLGIFNVNMPLLYGEGGEKAFIRLQEEIIKSNNDQTIFAWESVVGPGSARVGSEDIGILATTPKAFQHSGNLVPSVRNPNSERRPFEMTNLGLQIRLQFWQGEKDDEFLGILDCHQIDEPDKRVALRFGSSWSILKHTTLSDNPLLWAVIKFRQRRKTGRSEKGMEDIEISDISELYRDYKRGPIKDGATMFRRSGPLLFEEGTPSTPVSWYSLLGEGITTWIFLGGLPSITAAPEVFISQPRASRPPTTKILFKFPPGFVGKVLEPSHQALKVLTHSGPGFSLVITDMESHDTGRKDLYISLKRELITRGYRPFWNESVKTRSFVASFHWQSGQQTYSLLLDPRTLAKHGEMTRQELYTSRKRWAVRRLHLAGQQYSSLITNYGHHSVCVEIREDSWDFGVFWRNRAKTSVPFLMALTALPWFLVLSGFSGGKEIAVAYSLGLLISLCMFKPRDGLETLQPVASVVFPLLVISTILALLP